MHCAHPRVTLATEKAAGVEAHSREAGGVIGDTAKFAPNSPIIHLAGRAYGDGTHAETLWEYGCT